MNQEYVISIVLRARDEIAGALSAARTEIAAFRREANDTQSDIKNLNQSFDGLNRRLDTFATRMRSIRESIGDTKRQLDGWTRTFDENGNAINRVRDSAATLSDRIDNLTRSVSASNDASRQHRRTTDELGGSLSDVSDRSKETGESFDVLTEKHNRLINRAHELRSEFHSIQEEFVTSKRSREDLLFDIDRIANALKRMASQTQLNSEAGRDIDAIRREMVSYANAVETTRKQIENFYESQRREIEKTFDKQSEATRKQEDLDRQRATSLQRLRSLERTVDAIGPDTDINQQRSDLRELISGYRDLARSFEKGSSESRDFGRRAEEFTGRLKELNTTSRRTDDEVTGLRGSMNRLAESLDHGNDSVAKLDNQMRGLGVAALLVFAQQTITVLEGLGATLLAVASSAIEAGAAIGIAFTAAAAQATPAIGILVAAFVRVKDIMDAIKASDALQQAQSVQGDDRRRRQANSVNTIASANDSLRDAQERVADSQKRLQDAQINLTRARQDGVRELRDLILAEKEAELAARGAALSQEEAQRRLRETVAGGGDQADLARAELGVREASLGRQQAGNRLGDARTTANRARQGGVEGLQSVQNAVRQVETARKGVQDAEQAVERARRGLDNARRAATNAADDNLAAAEKLNFLLSQLTPSERKLYESLRNLRQVYRTNFRPITDDIIDSFDYAVDRAAEIIGDGRVVSSFRKVAGAISDSIRELTDSLTTGSNLDRWNDILDQSAQNIDRLTPAFADFADAILAFADAGSPIFSEFVDWTRELARTFNNFAQDDDKINPFIDRTKDNLESWKDLIVATTRLLAALIGASEEEGQNAVEDLTGQINKATDYIHSHSREVRQFFSDAREVAEDVASVLWEIVKAAGSLFNPDQVDELAQFFKQTLIPVLTDVIELIGHITDAFLWLANTPGFGEFLRLALTVGAISAAIDRFTKLIVVMGLRTARVQEQFGAMFRVIGAGFRALIAGEGISGAIAAMRRFGDEARAAQALGGIPGGGRPMPRSRQQYDPNTGMYWPVPLGTNERTPRQPGIIRNALNRVGLRNTATAGATIEEREAARRALAQTTSTTTRLRRAAPRAGLIGIGAAIAGNTLLTGPDDFRNFAGSRTAGFGNIGGAAQASLDTVSGSLQSLMSLDLGGFLRSLGGLIPGSVHKLQEFGNTADAAFKKAVSERNEKGLRDLAKQATDLADKYPKAADSLRDFANKASEAADEARATEIRMRALGQAGENLIKTGDIKENEILDPEQYKRLQDAMERLSSNGANSIRSLRQLMREQLHAINQDTEVGSQTWQTTMAEHFRLGIQAVERSLIDGKINHKEAMEEINRITKQNMKFMRDNMDDLSDQGRQRLSENFAAAAEAVARQMTKAERNTEEGMKKIRRLYGQSLRLYGFDEKDIDAYARGADPLTHKNSSAPLVNKAVGGFIGLPGERGSDTEILRVGRGEAILNAPHQAYVEPALQAFYGHGLTDMFKRVKGWHGGPDMGGFATGRAGLFDGHPTNVNSGVARIVEIIKRRFPLTVSSTTDHSLMTTSGNISDHSRGAAVDLSGPKAVMDRAAQYVISSGLVRRLKQAIYAGNPELTYNLGENVGPGFFGPAVMSQHANHLHLAIAGALRGALRGIDSALVRRVLVQGIDRSSALGRIAQGALDNSRRAANMNIRNLLGMNLDTDVATTAGGEYDKSDLRGLWLRAASRMHVRGAGSVADVAAAIALAESGGNPIAHNPSGASGLWQILGQVVRGNIFNPLVNAMNAVKKWLDAGRSFTPWTTYTGADTPNHERTYLRYMATGGGVGSGYGGGDRIPALLEEGEHVWTKEEVARAGGHHVMVALRKMLGGGTQGGPNTYQEGGQTFATRLGSILDIDSARDLTPTGIILNIRSLIRLLDNVKTRTDNFRKAITGLAELTDRFTSVVTENANRARISLTRRAYRLQPGTDNLVVQRLTPDELSSESARIDLDERQGRSRQRSLDERELGNVRNRLARLRAGKGGLTDKEEPAYRRLLNERERLIKSISDADDRIGTLLADQYKRQQDALQRQIQESDNNAQRSLATNDIRSRFAEALGITSEVAKLANQRIDILNSQIKDLTSAQATAQTMGDIDTANSISQRIEDIRATIGDIILQQFDSSIEQINNTAQRRLGHLDLADRLLTATGVVGQFVAGAGGLSRNTIISQRNQVLTTQRDQLQGMLGQAVFMNNQKAVEDLTAQIEELNVQIAENSRAQFIAKIDDVNQRTEYATSTNDLRRQIVELTGEISGNVDSQRLLALAQDRATTLSTQRRGLTSLLDEARQRGDQQAVQDLTTQLLQNQVAILENTKQIKDLNGTLGAQTQSFTTTAFQLFRQSIFSGSGGLLANYRVPSMDSGGTILSDGLLFGHQGETVMPATVSRSYSQNKEGDINIEINQAGEPVDPTYLAKRIMFEKSSR